MIKRITQAFKAFLVMVHVTCSRNRCAQKVVTKNSNSWKNIPSTYWLTKSAQLFTQHQNLDFKRFCILSAELDIVFCRWQISYIRVQHAILKIQILGAGVTC